MFLDCKIGDEVIIKNNKTAYIDKISFIDGVYFRCFYSMHEFSVFNGHTYGDWSTMAIKYTDEMWEKVCNSEKRKNALNTIKALCDESNKYTIQQLESVAEFINKLK